MREIERIFYNLQTFLINLFVFLIPLFFLPITRDFVTISKFYFILYGVIILALVGLLHLAFVKKVRFYSNQFIQVLLLIIVSYILSIILMSPNKIQALYNPHSGLLIMFAFISIFYMATNGSADRKNNSRFSMALVFSGLAVGLMSMMSLVQPYKNAALSNNLLFLKSPLFNTVGTQIELVIFLTFALLIAFHELIRMRKVTVVVNNNNLEEKRERGYLLAVIFTVIIGVALGLQLYQIIRSITVLGNKIILPPLDISWYSAIEVLKNPITALFGVGVDNFAAIFTQVKPIAYNYTANWQVISFPASRSTLLHILTELGLLGLVAFAILFARIVKHFKHAKRMSQILIVYAIAMLVLFPPSLTTFFIFFIALTIFTHDIQSREVQQSYEIDFSKILPLHIAALIIGILLIGGSAYHISRTLTGEVYFKKAIDAIAANDLKGLYDNQRQAVILYPENEDFRINFSQTNLIIANSLASKKKEDITENDRQQIAQAIQASIAEGKAAVGLNPSKVTNWKYLASLYKSIINVAQGAEQWTVVSYQQAIRLDPNNPVHRLELGGVFYLFKNYDNAQKLFEEAVSMKNDWSNAWYNLAWTLYQKKNYTGAVQAMEKVLSLLNPQTQAADYTKAKNELEEFKKNAQTQTNEQKTQVNQGKNELLLPSQPVATVEPKLSLPAGSSPAEGNSR